MNSNKCLDFIRARFGCGVFRAGQHEVMSHVAAGRDAILLMSTSGGKLLCFQVPGLVRGGLTVVVTPLVSMMLD